MNYAPMIIPTLCRYESFVRCIESLRKNCWAKYTDVYIGLDYPKKETHIEGYEKIKEYLSQEFTEFKSFNVLVGKKNIGAKKNEEKLIKECFKNHDNYIYAEDDIEFSPNFLEYMDRMLDIYKYDESVIAVSGYSQPIKLTVKSGANAIKQQLQASVWGYGTWKNKIKQISRYLSRSKLAEKFVTVYLSGKLNKMTDWAIKDYISLTVEGVSKNSYLKQITDISLRIFLTVEDKYIIMPTVSKTRNLGFDGNGIYCPLVVYDKNKNVTSKNFDYANQEIDCCNSFFPCVDNHSNIDENRAAYNCYDVVKESEMDGLIRRADSYCKLSKISRKFITIKLLLISFLKKIKKLL